MKNLKCKVLALCMGASVFMCEKAFSQVPSYVPTNGLVGWWPFNGNANDESGNGNNGTVNGATLTNDRNGNMNSAYSFDGVNDYINFGDPAAFDFSNSNFTISIWAERLQLNNLNNYDNSFVIGKWDHGTATSGQNEFAIVFNISPMPVNTVGFYLENGINMEGTSSNTTVLNNVWTNVTIKRNFDSVYIFINGFLNESGYIGTSQINNIGRELLLGTYFPNNPNHISPWNFNNAKFDDIAIWNRALTDQEINTLYYGCGNEISSQPSNAINTLGANAQFSLNAVAGSTYQWQSNPSNFGWQNVPSNASYFGATTNTLTVSNTTISNHHQPFRAIVNAGGCVDTSDVAQIIIGDTCLTTVTDTLVINATLSLPAPNNENTILIYPNPASDHITIDNGNYSAMAGYTIKIENNAGQQVFQSLINQAQFYVDLSTWSGNGLYFVHLIDAQGNTVTVRKIVLQ